MRSMALLAVAAALAACPRSSEPPLRPPPAAPASGELQEEACLNAWIAQHGLNTFGDPPDRMYPGGTPLFDERTGTLLDRREYIYRRHPDAKQACSPRR